MNKTILKSIFKFSLFYFIFILGFYFIGGEQIRTKAFFSKLPEANTVFEEVSEGTVIEQEFIAASDTIDKITLYVSTFGRENRGHIVITLIDTALQQKAAELTMEASLLDDNSFYEWQLENPILNTKGRSYTITIGSECPLGEAPTFYYHNTALKNTSLKINDESIQQTLCFSYAGSTQIFLGTYYWVIVGILTLFIFAYFGWVYIRMSHGKKTLLGTISGICKRYGFLFQQLVIRDFKTKYKRSVLGYLWSFLNPLLTMTVQYIVFSTIFRSDIKNFPVYLLSGIILFNFFVDAVSQGLSAIVNNSSLITKVYVPKYIYPVTKVISSAINLVISVIPLLLVALFTGAPISLALTLLPFGMICIIIFSIGLSLALSSAMVFFRDTQYLWGIVNLAWMYATPIFYPESIIPPQYKFIHQLNPMYYMIKFVRTLMIEGVSPEPKLYAYCLLSSLIALIVGAYIFKKTQDRFVLYI